VNNIAPHVNTIPAMSDVSIASVRELEASILEHEQVPVVTQHIIHAGVYMRTITMVPGSLLAGALIKISTTLIVSGDVTVYTEGGPCRFAGYHVLPASAGRKQAILAHDYTDMTMLFGTDATTVEDAEAQFTDELSILASRKDDNANTILVTGE
tara:strand:- start:434 stop:895 length:462 start_codon:yes stop_codon:yes gene_type:complete